MKLGYQGGTDTLHIVAPFAGAWIEIESMDNDTLMHAVAPFAGAWIEIMVATWSESINAQSLPSRERGLKFLCLNIRVSRKESLPSRERGLKSEEADAVKIMFSRSLRGSVD